MEVRGDRFELVQQARMYVNYGSEEHRGELCRIVSKEAMICRTPDLRMEDDRRLRPTVDRPLELDYGFELDAVQSQRNLSMKSGFNPLTVYPDPIIDRFPGAERLKYFKGLDDYLTINGRHMDLAAKEEDVRVRIGTDWCNLTALASKALTCRPPSEEPPSDDQGSEHPQVVVQIGYRRYTVSSELVVFASQTAVPFCKQSSQK